MNIHEKKKRKKKRVKGCSELLHGKNDSGNN
jgi:hypothetical protein